MMTLNEFYRLVEKQYNEQQEKVNEYIAIAKVAGVAESDYKKDSVYIALVENAEKYRFTKNLVMSHLKITKGSDSFFKR